MANECLAAGSEINTEGAEMKRHFLCSVPSPSDYMYIDFNSD